MATITEEIPSLKLRAAKRQGEAKITIVDHTSGETFTCTVTEGIRKFVAMADKGAGSHMVHIVDAKEERERKLKNPKNSMKRIFNCRTPEQYKEFNAALEPYFEEAVDPHLAIDLVVKALSAFSRNVIRDWVRQGAEHPDDLPEFLREG